MVIIMFFQEEKGKKAINKVTLRMQKKKTKQGFIPDSFL